jgi:hypothetical protein
MKPHLPEKESSRHQDSQCKSPEVRGYVALWKLMEDSVSKGQSGRKRGDL